MKMLIFRRCLPLALALAVAASAPAAGTVLSLYAATTGDAHSFLTGFQPVLAVTHVVTATSPAGSADAFADVRMGEIHVTTHAVVNKGAGLSSESTTEARANDEVFATGDYRNQPIRVRWTLALTGKGYGSAGGLTDGSFLLGTGSNGGNVGTTYRLQISEGTTTYNGFYSGSASFEATYLSGQQYALGLTFFSTISYFGTDGPGTGGLEYGNTGHAYAEILTPGATLSSTSGHDYTARPVPEPRTWAALGLGAAGLLRRRRSL